MIDLDELQRRFTHHKIRSQPADKPVGRAAAIHKLKKDTQ